MSVVTTTADEVPKTTTAYSRLQPDVVRTGVGSGPNTVLTASLDGVDVYSSCHQIPLATQFTVADDVVVVTWFVSAPPGTRWSEIDITTGDVLVYGPRTQHTSASPAGLEMRGAVIDLSVLDDVADSLHKGFRSPAAGSAALLNPTDEMRHVAGGLHAVGSPFAPSGDLPAARSRLLPAVVNALTGTSVVVQSRPRGLIRSRDVVHECVEYADAVGRGPSIPELCSVAHVSERRLRAAFYDTFNVAPSVFFRTRILSHARDRLLSGDQSVAEAALDAGFEHLGRFAKYYADMYGEYPHDTLARARSAAGSRRHRPLAPPTRIGPIAPRLGPLPA